MVFVECEFVNCDMSTVNINMTAFREVQFKGCKMLGLRFETCNEFLFAVSFDSCQLDFTSFYQRNLRNTRFARCGLKEVDFVEADLTNASFTDSDLTRASFEGTTLVMADFRNASNFSIDPDLNKISKTRFSREGLAGLLNKYDISIE